MILLTKLNGEEFFLNAEYIEFIEKTADTIIITKTGKRIRVKESAEEVVERIKKYKKEITQVIKVEYRYSQED